MTVKFYFDLCRQHCKENNNTLVLMQVGKFFEAYDTDENIGSGKKISEILHMNLVKKNKSKELSIENPYQCGFPSISLYKHITKLNDEGYTVYVYEQDQYNAKDRKLKGKYTSNIRLDDGESENCNNFNSTIYSYVIEKYPIQKGNIKIYEYSQHYVVTEMLTGKIYLSETIDTDYNRMIEQFFIQNNPTEILFHIYNFDDNEVNEISKIVKRFNEHFTIREWNENINTEINTRYITNYDNFNLYAYSNIEKCLSILLNYINEHDSYYLKNLYLPEDLWIRESNLDLLKFNRDLFRELFIFSIDENRKENVHSEKKKTVYDILSKGMNNLAKRHLTKLLRNPKTNIDEIQNIYSKIETIECDKELKKIYRDIIDIEWYLLRWSRDNISYNCLGILLQTYKDLEIYFSELTEFNHYVESVFDISMMRKYPNKLYLYEDFFVNNDEITELKNNIYIEHKKLEQYEKKDFVLHISDDIENCYFQTTVKKWNKLGKKTQDTYRVIEKKNSIIKVMPLEADSIRMKIESNYEKLKIKQKKEFNRVNEYIEKNFMKILKNVNLKITEESTFSILKDFFKINNYCKPNIKNGDSFCSVDKMRNCIIENIDKDKVFVPFSFNIDRDTSLGSLIYGMNSSGKSTFMKSLAVSLWLAQCGLYVPASNFSFSPFNAIYSKFSHTDNIYLGHSLFVNEISELDYILKHSDDRTLILLDELTSGTEVHSSSSLIISIINEFFEKNFYFCFTTHIHWIGKYLEKKFNNLKIYHFKFDYEKNIKENLLITKNIEDFYNRTLQEGTGPEMYGIEVAEKLGISNRIIKNAYKIREGVSFDYEEHKVKKSKYNSKLAIDKCINCGNNKNLHTHHILPQQYFSNDNNKIEGFDKNALYNLIILCEKCHNQIHSSCHN